MAKYVDGFVLVVPRGKVAVYKKMAQWGKRIWMKHGALDYKECMGADMHPKGMEMDGVKARTFPEMANAKGGETVWFSFIVFKSKKHRDQINAKVMKDPAMSPEKMKDMPMPWDMKRFTYGGFTVEVDA